MLKKMIYYLFLLIVSLGLFATRPQPWQKTITTFLAGKLPRTGAQSTLLELPDWFLEEAAKLASQKFEIVIENWVREYQFDVTFKDGSGSILAQVLVDPPSIFAEPENIKTVRIPGWPLVVTVTSNPIPPSFRMAASFYLTAQEITTIKRIQVNWQGVAIVYKNDTFRIIKF